MSPYSVIAVVKPDASSNEDVPSVFRIDSLIQSVDGKPTLVNLTAHSFLPEVSVTPVLRPSTVEPLLSVSFVTEL